MTLYDFRQLDINAQAEATYHGVFLGQRQEDTYKINLYAVDSFYVEIYYCPIENEIKRFKAFKSIASLEPYLNSFDLR